MRARFGTAGNPDGFYQAGKKQSKDMPPWLREQGLEAYEYQCGKGVTVGEATARAIGRAAAVVRAWKAGRQKNAPNSRRRGHGA